MKLESENINLNLRHLRALHAVAEEGSFSAAAARLSVVPSALSELVRQLEASIGAPLFDRRTRPPAITPLGQDFLRDTHPLLNGMDRAVSRLRQSAGLEDGTLLLGASPSAISDILVPVLQEFLNNRPGLRCRLHDDIAETLAHMVSDGRLDLAVAGRAQHSPDLRQRAILHDPVGLACCADHPLAAKDTVTLDDLDASMLIGLDPNTGTQHLLKGCAAIPDDFLTPRLQAHSTIAQLCMIRAGLGVALLPRNAVMLFRDPQICFVPVAGLDLWRSLYLLEPARRPMTAAARAFVAELETHIPLIPDD
ncbi:LysR family transcriptional regulator [Roseinatronobacter sp. NSM]|uniref:LysR family transcriptional regulator n=1 Tax=Roseinatronobacter sp. NSM TaxID=3457785 RepID=UPI004036754B